MRAVKTDPAGTPTAWTAPQGVPAIICFVLLVLVMGGCAHHVEKPTIIKGSSEELLDWGTGPPEAADRAGHRFHTKRPFEWWYIDGHLDTGETFVGVFFDPSFTGDYAAVTFSLYDQNWNGSFHAKGFRDGELYSSTEDARIESPAGYLRRIDDQTYQVLWDMDDVRAEFTLSTIAPGWRPRHDEHSEEDLEFFWVVHQGRNHIEGTLTRDGKTTEVSGIGYFDHNWGVKPLHKITTQWVWGRVLADDYTIIYADVQYIDPAIKGRPLYLAHGKEVILGVGSPTVIQEDFVTHPRLKRHYPRRIIIEHSGDDIDIALTITFRSLAEEVDLLRGSGMNRFARWVTRTFLMRPSYFRIAADFEGVIRRGDREDRLSGECLYEIMIFE